MVFLLAIVIKILRVIQCRIQSGVMNIRLIAGLDILHLPYAGFVAGVETVRAVELSRDDFSLFDENVQ